MMRGAKCRAKFGLAKQRESILFGFSELPYGVCVFSGVDSVGLGAGCMNTRMMMCEFRGEKSTLSKIHMSSPQGSTQFSETENTSPMRMAHVNKRYPTLVVQ